MKVSCAVLAAVWVLGLAVGASAGNAQFSNRFQDVIDQKNANVAGNHPTPWEPLVGGETIATATPIATLPYSDAGSTAGHINDYDAVCPFTGSTSPDLVYKYAPEGVTAIEIDLCNSSYDTKVYVYDNDVSNLVACNDDYCHDPAGNPYRSFLPCVPVSTGHTYYIVVDGYGGDAGDYHLSVVSCCCPEACSPTACPPDAQQENEPVCFDGYLDEYDAGCNSVPPTFVDLGNGGLKTVCGQGGDYLYGGLNYRDTDWYQIDLSVYPWPVTACVCASFNVQLAIINGNIGCGSVTLTCGSVFGVPGESICCGPVTVSGLVWIFVAASDFIGWPCDSPYTLTIDAGTCCPTSTENTSWGEVKGLYR